MKIDITPVGANNVIQSFDRLPDAVRRRLVERIGRLTRQLEGRVRAAAPRRAGRLARGVRSKIFVDTDRVRGRVFIAGGDAQEHRKAGALEYGARRMTAVRAHQRRMSLVERYSRRVNIAERRFLRGPLDAMRGQAMAEIAAAVGEAMPGGARR